MKATIAVTCFFSAVVLISALSEEKCRAPRPTAMCGPGAPVRVQYYFNNSTDKCEPTRGCDSGENTFDNEGECQRKCPFGQHASEV
uniref:Putative salivary kunitz domain protein n=1 Tax=Ixodes ricinus TaxID=34613 RepID=A0A0K8RJS7_IXORI